MKTQLVKIVLMDIYILEVHLEYHDELHSFHNDYPLAPEKHEISNDILSNYCNIIADKYGIKINAVKNLVPNWGNKSKYVVHYRNLQLYLPLRMKLTKVHEVLKLINLTGWRLILILTQKKEKPLLIVLKNNFLSWWLIASKTMENLRNGIKVKSVHNTKDYIYIKKKKK